MKEEVNQQKKCYLSPEDEDHAGREERVFIVITSSVFMD